MQLKFSALIYILMEEKPLWGSTPRTCPHVGTPRRHWVPRNVNATLACPRLTSCPCILFRYEEQYDHTALKTVDTKGLPFSHFCPSSLHFYSYSSDPFIPQLPIMKNSSVIYWALHSNANDGLYKTAANKVQCSLIQYVSTAGMLSPQAITVLY